MPKLRGSSGQRAHIKLSLWKITSGVWSRVCVCVLVSKGAAPHPLRQWQHSHISSSVLQRQGAPAQVGCSGSICCYYFPLIIGLNNGMPVSPSSLKPYTLFIFQRSHFCSSRSLSPLFSPVCSLPRPCVASPLIPSPFTHVPFERVSHENDRFDWPHQYVSLSVRLHSPGFLEGFSSHSRSWQPPQSLTLLS